MASLVCLTDDDRNVVITWLSRCVARFETLPPSEHRDFALREFREQIDRLRADRTVVPLRPVERD
jgi:hypothetical protein